MLILDAIVFLMAVAAGCMAFFLGRSRRVRLTGGIFALALTGMGFVYFVALDMLEPEWNPLIANDSEIAGVWTEGNERLELSADGHYAYGTPPTVKTGTWVRDDWNLTLKPGVTGGNASSTLMRFIQFRGRYRILTNPPDEPGVWLHDYGLVKN
jgi:hypothetical protein